MCNNFSICLECLQITDEGFRADAYFLYHVTKKKLSESLRHHHVDVRLCLGYGQMLQCIDYARVFNHVRAGLAIKAIFISIVLNLVMQLQALALNEGNFIFIKIHTSVSVQYGEEGSQKRLNSSGAGCRYMTVTF